MPVIGDDNMATKSTKSGKKVKRKPAKKNLDPHHKDQGYGKPSTWSTSYGKKKYTHVRGHYRSS